MVMLRFLFFTCLLCSASVIAVGQLSPEAIVVKPTDDFQLTGNGSSTHWDVALWNSLPVTQGEDKRQTRFKVLYSVTGIYFLFHNEDKVLTATKTADFERLWEEDVAEVFLWPDTTNTIYFEYEISPLNVELPILIPNLNGKFLGWRPWEYSGERKTRHLTSVTGGSKKTGSAITAWYAEFFIPYKLMMPLNNVPPKRGTEWRANMYRVDYDDNKVIEWSWKKTEKTFHQFSKFGRLIFD
jgi:hypothetical protein